MSIQRSIRVGALAGVLAVGLVALTAAGPGSGTAIISPSASVSAGSSGTWSVVYTAAEVHDDGTLRVTIPSGWTAPQDASSSSPGFVTVATNEPTGAPGLSIAGQVITVVVDTLTSGNTITVVYGDDTSSSSGRAVAATSVGSHVFVVASDPAGGSPSNIGTSPSLNVIPGAPASLDIVPNDTTGVAAGSFVQLHVRVLDAFGNRTPVPANRTINLTATHGAYYDPANHSTPITSAVIASGTSSKRVDYRPTLVPGSPHQLIMFTQSGSPSLGGTETVGVVPAAMSPAQGLITATTPVVANGVAQSSVRVTSRDAFGNRRTGDSVTIDATGTALDVDPPLPTDAMGEAVGVVTNTVAEPVTVSAQINGQAITATAPVTFTAGPPSGATSLVDATTGVVANGVATSVITVTVRDANNNPVAGQQVNLAANPVLGTTLSQPGGVTNTLGQVTGTVAATTTVPRTITASFGPLPGTPITDNAVVQFVAGPLANFLVNVDGAATAGIDDPVIITARDAQGNTITDFTGTVNLTTTSGETNSVEWSQNEGDGSIGNIPGTDDGTYTFALSDAGQAQIAVRNTKVETFRVSATSGAPTGTSGSLVVTNNSADKIELVAGNGQSATVNTPVATLPLVRVIDQYNNPVPGATVTFTAVGGGGSVDVTSGGAVDSTGVTGSDGRIDCDVWRLGTIAGLNRLRARIASGTVTSVDFTATGTAGPGTTLVLTPTSKSVTQGTFETVTATLTDAFTNPKSNERVDIVVKSGLNGTLAEDPIDPGTTTPLNPLARWGNTDAAGRVTVRWNAPGGAGLADVIDASTSSVGQGSVADVTYTTTAGGATNLRITFVGPSTRPADQTFQFLVEAVDGNGNVDATNTSTVNLNPEAGSNLLFSLTDFGSTVTQVTLVNGARTVYGRGTTAGDWDITTTGGGLGADTEVVTITDTGTIDHYAVTTVPSVIAGVVFDVTVEAQDVHNNRVVGANNAVTLEAYDDVANNPALASLLDPSATLVNGRVTVAETYTKAEAIRVRASASGRQGFSAIVTVSAAGAHHIVKVSGDATGVVAGANQVLTAQVLDAFDNPVNGALVTFTVQQGGGTPAPPSASTDGNGNVSTTLTTGVTVGENRLKATILDENPAGLERIDYLVTTVPGSVASFQVTPASYSLVAGTGVALNVTGFDANSNLVSNDNGTPINLTETGSAQFGAASGTLTAGQFNTTVVDTVAESFTITATRQGGGATGTSGTLTVANAGAYRVTKVSGDASGVTAGAAQALVVLVRDNHSNPVPNALVTFATTGAINDGTFTDAVGDPNDGITTTNGAGQATVTFTTSTTAGANQVNATILDGTPAARERVTFTVNTVAGGIAYYTVQMSGTTAVAGTTRNATITAFDANDNQVDDDVTQVDLSGDPGTLLVFGADPVTLTNGVATTTVRADQVQTYRVRARTVGIPAVTGLGPDVTVTPANPAGTITGTPTPATITANGVSTSNIVSSVITDAFGNQVPAGTLINVSATNGGVVLSGTAKMVGAGGTIAFDLRSSTTVGTSVVTMTSQLGTATGTVNVAFAPPPAFVSNQFPTPRIVAPASSVSFSVPVQNTSSTDANLTTATLFTFTDGTRVYSANLSSATTIPGPGTQTLVFNSVAVVAAFTPGNYAPNVVLVGSDEFSAPINTTTALPANSVLVTSIQITAINPPPVVSRGQTTNVTVSVKNNGTQTVHIDDIDLVFNPTGDFDVGTITPADVLPGATGNFAVPVTVDPSCTVGDYTIDAVATGDVGGFTVTDNSLAPFALPTWTVVTAADLSYVAGSMTPITVTRGDGYAFRATIANGGAGIVLLDSALTYLQFTDGTRTYQVKPSQPYAIAGSAQQQIIFKARTVPNAFTPGAYVATFNLQGTESGANFQQTVTSGADVVTVQTPANVASGSVLPDQVSKGSSVAFTVQVTNSGGSTVVLTPATTRFRFASSAFNAALDPAGTTVIPPGGATLTFLSTTVSTSITAGTYPGQLVLVGTENGNAFAPAPITTENVVVMNAPNIQILSNAASQSPITADQARAFKVRMVVANNGGAAVTFTDASIQFIQAGADRSGQFQISDPAGFVLGGSTLNGGAVDTLLFNVSDNTGNAMTAPAMMTIEGHLEVEDVNTQQPIFAERELGDFLQVQTQAALAVLAVLPSRTTVTQSMARDFIVRAVVQNTGGSDMTLNLAEPATDVSFSPAAGWVATPRNQLGHGGNVLTGGEVDTVLFDVTTSGSTSGTALISTTYSGAETNSGRPVPGGSSGSASVLVQSPGALNVTNVVASTATLTSGGTVAWTLTVTLENPGQSDVNVALPGAVTVAFPGAAPAPGYTVPSSLAGGGTLLSGGETDQLVINVNGTGTYATMGSKAVNVTANGVEVNSGVPRNGNGGTNVTVQRAPTLNVVLVAPGTVSRGSSVGFAVTIANTQADAATATLDRFNTRLRFGGGQYDVNLTPISPVDVNGGEQITLLFATAAIAPAIPLGNQADAVVQFRWSANGDPNGSENEGISGRITVQNAPALNIVNVRPSRSMVTADQTTPAWTITMVVRNSNGAAVDLNLAPATTRLQLNLLGAGSNVTNEYSITQPTQLFGGGVNLASGETDSLIFNVAQAGDTPGNVIVSGFVGGTDLNSGLPVSDNTGDGGSGSFVLQTPGELNILSITPDQPTATIGQTGVPAQYAIKMAVRNNGQAAVNLDLAPPTATALDFDAPAGWATSLQTTLVGGGVTLSGGETDTVVFNVTTTGSTVGSQLIYGDVAGNEINTNAPVADDADSGGWGSITLQSPAALDILSITPTPGELISGSSQPWDITIVVENTGDSDARLSLPAGLTMTVQNAPGATFDPVNFLEEGGVVLAGGATGTLVVHGDNSPTFSTLGANNIGARIDAVELNSNRSFFRNETIGSVIARAQPNLTVTLNPNPTTVTRGSQAFLQVRITNPGANAAPVTLDRGETRVSFGGSYNAFLSLASPVLIGPGQFIDAQFEDKQVPTSLLSGPYNLTVDLGYEAGGLDLAEVETVTNGINVLDPSEFRITGISTSQPSATAGQTANWTATMSIANDGPSPIEIDFNVAETYLRFVAPGGGFDTSYDVIHPTQLDAGGTSLGAGLTGDLTFIIDQTGTMTGPITISGRVRGTDGTVDDTFDGGRGSILVVPASAVSVVATHTSQPRVTAGQSTPADWDVRVVVTNTGGGAVNVDLATAAIAFDGGTGWVVETPPVFLGGGNPLEGGSVDSLLFRVTTTAAQAGTRRIDATIPWQDVNTLATGTANTSGSGSGSIVVQTPPAVRVTTTTSQSPNPNAVNLNQTFAVRVQVENTGQADARDVALALGTNGSSTIFPLLPITEVLSGQTVVRDFDVDAAGAPASETFTSTIGSVTDANSGQPVAPQAPVDATAVVAIQNPAAFDIFHVRPSQPTVTRGQTTPWNVIVRVRNTGQAGAVLAAPAANDLAFGIGGSNQTDYVVQPPTVFGSGNPGWTLAGGATDSLIYAVNVTGGNAGLVDIDANLDGTDGNDPPATLGDNGFTSVNVQAPAGLAVASTVPFNTVNHASADRDTVNTNFAYEIHVTVANTGEAVDSVLVQLVSDLPAGQRSTIAPKSLRRQQIDVDGSHQFEFRVTAPTNPVVLETFTASILPGARSHNTGQPVTPQPAVDNRHVVVTQRRADLVMNLTSASGAVSTNQVFTMSATVGNTGQAGVAGYAQLTLALPANFVLQNPGSEPPTRAFTVGTPVTWQVVAPAGAQSSLNFSCAIDSLPEDNNTGLDAFASQNNDAFGVAVVAGGAFTSPTIAIATPAGALDGTVSATQTFEINATVTATTTTQSIVATLSVPAGFQIVGAPTRNLGTGTGAPVSIAPNYFDVIAPASAGIADVFVTFTGVDANTQQPVPTGADSVRVTTVPRAALTATALVTAPPEATDNTVTIGTQFTVAAQVANEPSAAGIANPGTLTIQLPSGYALAGGETAAKPFTIATPVSWQVVAPPQPSGPQQINVVITTVPPDENSGVAALVLDGTASIAMVTEGSAVAVRDVSGSVGVDVRPVPAGTADVRMLGFEVAYNVSDPSVADARIDTIAVTVVGADGSPLSANNVAATLTRVSIDLGGGTPYEVADPSTNPVVVSLLSGGADRIIAPDATRNAIVSLSLENTPAVTELSVGLRSGALAVRDSQSNQRLGVTDSQGNPLDGVITSEPLVVLSSRFDEYVHNYPNPFRAGAQSTNITYVMENTGSVNVQIYDLTGGLVFEENIAAGDARTQPGPQETTWDGRNGKGEVVRNGVYVCVLNAGGRTAKFRIAVAK